jgi:hypothetical protein
MGIKLGSVGSAREPKGKETQMATTTATRKANTTAVRNARPGTKPAIHVDAKPAVPSVLDGVTAPVKETAATRRAAKLAAAKAAAKNSFELAAIAAGPLAVGAKAPKATPEPKVNVNESKNALAALIIAAAGAAIADANLLDFPGIADPAKLASQWLHYLPVGAEWPAGLPVPARSEWNADGTRV